MLFVLTSFLSCATRRKWTLECRKLEELYGQLGGLTTDAYTGDTRVGLTECKGTGARRGGGARDEAEDCLGTGTWTVVEGVHAASKKKTKSQSR